MTGRSGARNERREREALGHLAEHVEQAGDASCGIPKPRRRALLLVLALVVLAVVPVVLVVLVVLVVPPARL